MALRRLTDAPLPTWANLWKAAFHVPASDLLLGKPWCRPGDVSYLLSRSAWSMAALALLRRRLFQKQNVSVWIPDFFCNASLLPLRRIKANLVFYPINWLMQPDFSAFSSLVTQQPPDIFLLVHYFGQPCPVIESAAFCKTQGAWLVEDATHVLKPIDGVGQVGDCVLYSPHKHLPISDGAVLVIRQNGPGELARQEAAVSALCEILSSVNSVSGFTNRNSFVWLGKRFLQRLGFRRRQTIGNFTADAENEMESLVHSKISAVAKRMLSSVRGDIESIAKCREENASEWINLLSCSEFSGNRVDSLPVVATPYLVGFHTDQTNARRLFHRWQANQLPVSTWPDLPPEVKSQPSLHQVSITLRQSRVYLPVHQAITKAEILESSQRVLNTAPNYWKLRVLNCDQWNSYWRRCPKANLLQSWEYGDVKEETEGWKAQRFLISDPEGEPIALIQVLTRSLPVVGGIARLNRGPLLLSDRFDPIKLRAQIAALRVLIREANRQRWWVLQVAPELVPNAEGVSCLRALGFRRVAACAPWASALLDLTSDEDVLREKLNGKWRNGLRKGEKLGVSVSNHACAGAEYDYLIRSYRELQNSKGFKGLPERLLRGLANQQGPLWQARLFLAWPAVGGEPIGVLVTVRHGDTVTYLIGSVNDEGRKQQANSVLLWQAILDAKQSGVTWFDVGGLSADTPKGIADFKRGLNAEPYSLIGEWRLIHFPWRLGRVNQGLAELE